MNIGNFEIINKLADEQVLPRFVKVKQHFNSSHIEPASIKDVVFKELNKSIPTNKMVNGMSVCITCGSRGIANIEIITKAIGEFFLENDCKPFVVPSMGSHGGATAAGQLEVLASLGVTEDYLGFPIKASMETVQVGKTPDGIDVMIDKNAASADAIFVAGRIKAHTAFEGPYESGIMKMITIGLGKQHGAEIVHASGFGTAAKTIPTFAKTTLENTNIIGALGIIENAYDETYDLVGMTPSEIITEEPKLLKKAKSLMGRIFIPEVDCLVVDEIGKNISGDGMDPNVTGAFGTPYKTGGLKSQRIVILNLTDETHGNFNGLGMSHVTTKRVLDKLNLAATYPNAITSTVLNMVKIPLVMPSDEGAIKIGIRSCNRINYDQPRVVRIKNTMKLYEYEVSEPLIAEIKSIENMEVASDPYFLPFDDEGNLL